MPCVGLIVNDGKDLALATAERIESRFRQAGYDVMRASSAEAAFDRLGRAEGEILAVIDDQSNAGHRSWAEGWTSL